MNIQNIKVVIGSNFGDEGKGQMTDYFAYNAKKQNKSCLIVCHNGSAQKGHTVVLENGIRHIFHHFGSGFFAGADTYFSKDFVISPIFFKKEYEELKKYNIHTNLYVNKKCKICIPMDIMINQEIENQRGNNRHGSCGYGFFETVKRSSYTEYKIEIDSVLLKSKKELIEQILDITNKYSKLRIDELNLKPNKKFEELINNKKIISNYVDDLLFFIDHSTVVNDYIIEDYNTVIFEGEQGLILDEDNLEYFPHLTPSHTGLYNPYYIIKNLGLNVPIEVCYITRTYLTRHGAGRLDNECKKEDINPNIIDLTNVPNEFQGNLRFAKLDVYELKNRIDKDFKLAKENTNYSYSIAVMHENEYLLDELKNEKYHSNGLTRNDIYKKWND